MVCETGSRSIECLKWGHLFQTARRLHLGPTGAEHVWAKRSQLSQACLGAVLRTKLRYLLVRWLNWCWGCARLYTTASPGMCRGWSGHLGAPRHVWRRWCASQLYGSLVLLGHLSRKPSAPAEPLHEQMPRLCTKNSLGACLAKLWVPGSHMISTCMA